jgi:hypothetical protein
MRQHHTVRFEKLPRNDMDAGDVAAVSEDELVERTRGSEVEVSSTYGRR